MPGPTIEDVLARIDTLETTLLAKFDELEWKKEEFADSEGLGGVFIYGDNITGQTFTPECSHTVASVRLKIRRQGSPGDVVVSIRATDGVGKPTGSDLCAITVDGNAFTTSNEAWETFVFDSGVFVKKDVKYAIIVIAPDGDTDNFLAWIIDSTGTSYTRGQRVKSNDGGSTWLLITSDLIFEEWQNRLTTISDINVKLGSGELEAYTESQHAR